MKRKILKKLVCVSGMLFIAIPAWSAVPSNLIPLDRTRDQAPVIADFGDHLFAGDMLLAKRGGNRNRGGNGGSSSNGNQSQNQEQTRAHIQTQTQLQNQERTQSKTQVKTRLKTETQSQ